MKLGKRITRAFSATLPLFFLWVSIAPADHHETTDDSADTTKHEATDIAAESDELKAEQESVGIEIEQEADALETELESEALETEQELDALEAEQDQEAMLPYPQHVFRVTEMKGKPVKNMQDEDIGEIEDLLVDVEQGRIPFAIVSVGGLGDLAESLFAVPIAALVASIESDDLGDIEDGEDLAEAEEVVFLLDINAEQLKSHPYLFRNEWPSFADRSYDTEIYRHYGLEPYWMSVEAPSEVQTITTEEATAELMARPAAFYKASDLIERDIMIADEDVGDVVDIIVDATNSYVTYTILDVDDLLDTDGKLLATPWSAIKVTYEMDDAAEGETETDDIIFTLNTDVEQLRGAPMFDEDAWPNMTDVQWGTQIYQHYQQTPYWQTAPQDPAISPTPPTSPTLPSPEPELNGTP